jgi:hypothetical protein
MATFTLTIELGNAAMTDALDIAEALKAVVESLESNHVGCDPIETATETIRDFNGNTVGQWSVTE